MNIVIKNYNSDLSAETKTSRTSSDQLNTTSSKASELVDIIFKEIKSLSFRNLGYSTYLVLDKEDTVIQRVLKVSSWISGIIPSIVLALYLYERILELYNPDLYDAQMDLYQQAQGYSRLEEYSDEEMESNPVPRIVEILPENPSTGIQDISISILQERVQDERATETPKELPIETKDDTSETSIQESLESEMVHHIAQEKIEKIPKFVPSRIQQNPSNTKIRDIITKIRDIIIPPKQENSQEFSPQYFEISTPIIENLADEKIKPTNYNINQIKKDIPRMKLFVNQTHCLDIKDFVNQFGLVLNEEEIDILPGYNSIIPKILHFSHQGIFANGLKKAYENIQKYSSSKTPTQAGSVRSTLYINWNAEFPEQTKITAETLFNIRSTDDGTLLPYTYILKIDHFLDREEITFKLQEEEIESSYVMINSSEITEEIEGSNSNNEGFSDADDFEILNIENINSNTLDIAYHNPLLNKP